MSNVLVYKFTHPLSPSPSPLSMFHRRKCVRECFSQDLFFSVCLFLALSIFLAGLLFFLFSLSLSLSLSRVVSPSLPYTCLQVGCPITRTAGGPHHLSS